MLAWLVAGWGGLGLRAVGRIIICAFYEGFLCKEWIKNYFKTDRVMIKQCECSSVSGNKGTENWVVDFSNPPSTCWNIKLSSSLRKSGFLIFLIFLHSEDPLVFIQNYPFLSLRSLLIEKMALLNLTCCQK